MYLLGSFHNFFGNNQSTNKRSSTVLTAFERDILCDGEISLVNVSQDNETPNPAVKKTSKVSFESSALTLKLAFSNWDLTFRLPYVRQVDTDVPKISSFQLPVEHILDERVDNSFLKMDER